MFRTDMARELCQDLAGIEGIREESVWDGDIEISRIQIETAQAAERLGKPTGCYVTMELPEENVFTTETQQRAVLHIAEELSLLMHDIPETGEVLVLGLGNRFVTPDSLGPRTVDKVYVTRQIKTHVPEAVPEGMRAVSAIAPGVLGTTGVETIEIVSGLVEKLQPAAVVCIDALASRRAHRISASVQLSNTGIQPGAGVHNRRAGITRDSIGIPVFAVGVPTVVDAVTIAGEVHETDDAPGKLAESLRNLVVTPKDIDAVIERASRRLAEGLNRALLSNQYEEIRTLMQS